jgi:hypothetical protein
MMGIIPGILSISFRHGQIPDEQPANKTTLAIASRIKLKKAFSKQGAIIFLCYQAEGRLPLCLVAQNFETHSSTQGLL